MDDPQIGVVFVSWCVPEHRLRDHFEWNDSIYRSAGACVFAVTDREYNLPDYAQCVIFPETRLPLHKGQRRFSLTRTKNAGLRAAIAAGCDPIICSDVDICFEPDAWGDALAVTDLTAAVPVYRMSHSAERSKRADAYDLAELATGTVTMTAANWRKIHYCERQWGYGCDDGYIVEKITDAKIDIIRLGCVYHMAHIDGTPQEEFNEKAPRVDHWNRDSGLNPENFRRNARFQRR